MIKYLITKECKLFLRDPFLSKFALVFPLMIMLVLPLVVTMDVKNIKVAVVDNDGTLLSRQLVNKIEASQYFLLKEKLTTYEEGLKAVEYGHADVVLRIPPDFEKQLLSGQTAEALVAANATDATKGGLGSSYLAAIIAEFANEVFILQTAVPAQPSSMQISQLNLFNKQMNYRTFMLPALMGMVIIIISGVFPALAIVSEKERGTIEQMNVTPVSKWQFILAKLIPYWVIGIAVMSIAFIVAAVAYNFKPEGSLLTVYAATVLMCITMSGISLLISNYSNSFQQAIYLFFFVMIISLMLSGLFTPTTSMPPIARYFSYLLPPKYFMEIMRGVYLKGSGFTHLATQFAVLGAFAVFFSLMAMWSYKKRN